MWAGICKERVGRRASILAEGMWCAVWYVFMCVCVLCFLAGLSSSAPRSGGTVQPRLLRIHVGTSNLGSEASSPSLSCASFISAVRSSRFLSPPLPSSFASTLPSVTINPQSTCSAQPPIGELPLGNVLPLAQSSVAVGLGAEPWGG